MLALVGEIGLGRGCVRLGLQSSTLVDFREPAGAAIGWRVFFTVDSSPLYPGTQRYNGLCTVQYGTVRYAIAVVRAGHS